MPWTLRFNDWHWSHRRDQWVWGTLNVIHEPFTKNLFCFLFKTGILECINERIYYRITQKHYHSKMEEIACKINRVTQIKHEVVNLIPGPTDNIAKSDQGQGFYHIPSCCVNFLIFTFDVGSGRICWTPVILKENNKFVNMTPDNDKLKKRKFLKSSKSVRSFHYSL